VFLYVKVPSSPYKRGREGTCKWIQIFGTSAICRGNHCLSVLSLVLERVKNSLSRVRGIVRIFRITPNNVSAQKLSFYSEQQQGKPLLP
jgi:hypothetical protein